MFTRWPIEWNIRIFKTRFIAFQKKHRKWRPKKSYYCTIWQKGMKKHDQQLNFQFLDEGKGKLSQQKDFLWKKRRDNGIYLNTQYILIRVSGWQVSSLIFKNVAFCLWLFLEIDDDCCSLLFWKGLEKNKHSAQFRLGQNPRIKHYSRNENEKHTSCSKPQLTYIWKSWEEFNWTIPVSRLQRGLDLKMR